MNLFERVGNALRMLSGKYDAGHYNRVNNNWYAVNDSAENTDKLSRDLIRARARDLERNSDLMNAVVSAFKRNVVGGGYKLQARTSNEELNVRLEKLWGKWCERKNCDVTGVQSFEQIIRMCVVRKKIDGGILIVKRYTDEGFIPLQLQLFEVDELSLNSVSPKNKGNKVISGVEVNPQGKPVGYWINQYTPDGLTTAEPIYIDGADAIFYFSKRRPSQVREMSDMTATITRIRDANEFMTAVSVKERITACLSVFIKRTNPITFRGTQAEKRHEYHGKTISPGMIRELNQGDEIQVVNPSGQATDAAGYIKLQQRLIGAGQGISYEATSRDMSETNYSSARQAIIEDELTYTEECELLGQVMDEIYNAFVECLYLSGMIDAKDFGENKGEYLSHEFIKTPKKWIDPQKEANANQIAIQSGQKTFKQSAAEQGQDWKEMIDDMADVIKYGQEKGVDMNELLFGYQNNGYQYD